MDYPVAVLEKAQRLEQLLLRAAVGEPLVALNAELDFALDADQLARWQTEYENGGCTWEAIIDGRHGHAHKIHSGIREYLYARKAEAVNLRAPHLTHEVTEKFGVEISTGHVNYLLRKRELTALPGRPPKPPDPEAAHPAVVSRAAVENAGIFFPRSSEGSVGSDGDH